MTLITTTVTGAQNVILDAQQTAVYLVNAYKASAQNQVNNGYATAINAVNQQLTAAYSQISNIQTTAANLQTQVSALVTALRAAADATTADAQRTALATAYGALATVTSLTTTLQLEIAKVQTQVATAKATAEWTAGVYATWLQQSVGQASYTALSTLNQQITAAYAAVANAQTTAATLVANLGSNVNDVKAVVNGVSYDAQTRANTAVNGALSTLYLAVSDAQARAAAVKVQVDATVAAATYLANQTVTDLNTTTLLNAVNSSLSTATATVANLQLTLINLANQVDTAAGGATATLIGTTSAAQQQALSTVNGALGAIPALSGDSLATVELLEEQLLTTKGELHAIPSGVLGLGAPEVVLLGIGNMDAAVDLLEGTQGLETVGATVMSLEEQVELLVNATLPNVPVDPVIPIPEVEIPVLPPYYKPAVDLDVGTVFAAPTGTWLNRHCRATPATVNERLNVVHAVVPYSGFAGAPQVSGYVAKVRDIIRAMDRALDESHSTFSQHYKLVCNKNSSGSWTNIAVTKVLVPKWADNNANKRISCGEADKYLQGHKKWGDPDTRRLRFYDTSINHGGPYKGWCFYGDSFALGDKTPGPANPNNLVFGYGNIDADEWPRGATAFITAGAMQEFGHSIGLVAAPPKWGGVSKTHDSAYHTRDYPDYMNAGYFKPDTTGVRKNCGTVPTTFRNTYVDCGRDTYWDPTPSSGEWLCNNYNVATDSLYFRPLALRPRACPPA